MTKEKIESIIKEINDLGTTSIIVSAKLWEKYEKKRIYVNQYWYVRQGRESRHYGVGYIDITGEKIKFVERPVNYPYCASWRYAIEDACREICKTYNNTIEEPEEIMQEGA